MRNVGGHVGKSKQEREAYTKALKHIENEPTIDESLKFSGTDDAQKDFSVPTSRARRRGSTTHALLEHIKDNLITYLLGVAVVVGVYFMIDSKVSLTRIDTNVEHVNETVKDLKTQGRETQSRLQKQESKTQEIEYRLTTVEKEQSKGMQGQNNEKPVR